MESLRLALGMIAGSLTTLAFLPQLLKVVKSRSTQDISLGMFMIFCTGVALWLVYGYLQNDVPLIVSNTVSLVLAGAILFFKLRYK